MTQLAMQVLFTLLETTAGSDEISSDLRGSWFIISWESKGTPPMPPP